MLRVGIIHPAGFYVHVHVEDGEKRSAHEILADQGEARRAQAKAAYAERRAKRIAELGLGSHRKDRDG